MTLRGTVVLVPLGNRVLGCPIHYLLGTNKLMCTNIRLFNTWNQQNYTMQDLRFPRR